MSIKVLDIDLAKYNFSIHGVDNYDKPVLKKTVRRHKLLQTIAVLPPCIIGVEACSGAHYWAREMKKVYK